MVFLLFINSRLSTRTPSFKSWLSLGGAVLLVTIVLSMPNFSIDSMPALSQLIERASCTFSSVSGLILRIVDCSPDRLGIVVADSRANIRWVIESDK